jgi:hypothetical protein
MKLKNTQVESMDLTEEEKKYSWAREMIDNLTTTFPVMTSISKNAETTHFSFMGLGRHASLAESFIYKSNRFRTPSEVYRAAMYLGMSILYHYLKDEGTAKQTARADQVYAIIQAMESIDHSKMILDAVTLACRNVIECWRTGVVDVEERNEKIRTLIDALPAGLQKLGQEKVTRIMRSENITDIAETKLSKGFGKKPGDDNKMQHYGI